MTPHLASLGDDSQTLFDTGEVWAAQAAPRTGRHEPGNRAVVLGHLNLVATSDVVDQSENLALASVAIICRGI